MLETLGLTLAEEIGLASIIGLDLALPELIVAEALIAAGFLAIRAVIKHHKDKQNQPQQPQMPDDILPEPEIDDEELNQEVIEENKQIDQDIHQQLQQEGVQQIENREMQQLVEREQRLDHLREDLGLEEETQRGFYLYHPEIREFVQQIERQEQEEEERKNNPPNNNEPNPGGNEPNPGGNGGGGDGGGEDPNPNDDEIYNPYNNDRNRNRNPHENPFKEILKQSAGRIASQFYNMMNKEKQDKQALEEGKITQEDYDKLQRENDLIKNQLEQQKQMLDILDAMGLNELTDEQSLVELEKIDEDIKQLVQKPVKVTDTFATDLVTF